MKSILTIFVLSLFVISVIPGVFATAIGGGVGVNIGTEDFAPRVWACGSRVVADDSVEPGRATDGGDTMYERINNYAFEGESITQTVLVMDKNGVEKLEDVFMTLGDSQGEGNDIEANCRRTGLSEREAANSELFDSCNAKILEEDLTFDSQVMEYYDCTFTVETADSMYGEYWITVEATDLDGLSGTMDENEYWFLNPVIALSIDGDLTFDNVRPGTSSYSDTILVGNDADAGSGVLLDMFISGTDFYDSASSGAACPSTNQLKLSNFAYFATNGAYDSRHDLAQSVPPSSRTCNSKGEGYCSIQYGDSFGNAGTNNPFYKGYEILQAGPSGFGPYYGANILAPGAEMALTFRLDLPEPCNGDFDTGQIYFWGEAI